MAAIFPSRRHSEPWWIEPSTRKALSNTLRAGFTIEGIFNVTKIDRWFLVQIKRSWILRRSWRECAGGTVPRMFIQVGLA
jgi:hypothetical protein